MSMSSQYETSSDDSSTMRFDPLDKLHDFHLRQHPETDVSVLTDDELVELLKRKDPKQLEFLDLSLTRRHGNEIGSAISLDSPTNSSNMSSSPRFSIIHASECSQTSVSTSNGSDEKASSQ